MGTEDISQTARDKPGAMHQVTIIVDGVEHKVRAGDWVVRDLKATLNIDPAKVLAEITPHGLVDLDDNATIKLHEKEQFMTHARSGGSSQ
jgi:hypothetical protein